MSEPTTDNYNTIYQIVFNSFDTEALKELSNCLNKGLDLTQLDHLIAPLSFAVLTDENKIDLSAELKTFIAEKAKEADQVKPDEYLTVFNYKQYSGYFPSWEVLNKQGLSYQEALLEIIIPSFHPLPRPDLQNKVLACAMLINTAALPPLGDNCGKECPVPVVESFARRLL